MDATLFLIPVTLGEMEHRLVLPDYNREVILQLRHFVVENVRTARRFLKKTAPEVEIDALTFYELNKHTSPEEISGYLAPLSAGESMGIISEAGCPAIADPGADLVALAQRQGFRVKPLVGPSSILMALMASGFNGQSFAFDGYLPIDKTARAERIKTLEARVYSDRQTQIFMEVPFRNNQLLEELLRLCRKTTRLCVASNISCEEESIHTMTVMEWRKQKVDINRQPTIFLIYE